MPAFITEFFNNPAGKGSTFLNIKATQEKFNAKFETINKKIIINSCMKKEDLIYINVMIPSSVEGIYYDVVLSFTSTNKSAGNSIEDMEMQVFSNSPSFLYTYAFAYHKQGLLIDELRRRLPQKMLTDIAKTKNPYGVLSYDFSVYAAMKYIIDHGYLTFSSLKTIDSGLSHRDFLRRIQDADKLQKSRKTQKDFNRLIEKQEKAEKIKNIKKAPTLDQTADSIKTAKKVKETKKVGYTKIAKRTKRI